MPYDQLAGMDSNFNFPERVREALANSPEVQAMAANLVPHLVIAALGDELVILDAGKLAAEEAVEEALDDSGIVYGRVEKNTIDPKAEEMVGGFVGENGRITDLVVNDEGKIVQQVIDDWSKRLSEPNDGLLEKTVGKGSQQASGGFVGENDHETELVFDKDGKVPASVLTEWSKRLGPMIGPYISNIPATALPKPVNKSAIVDAKRNLWVRDSSGMIRRQTSSVDQFAAWGDSLTDGWTKPPFKVDQSDAWPGVLSTLLGKPVYNGGKSGQSADEISLRAGGLVLVLKPTGGVIPASGTVTVTTSSSIMWRTDRYWSNVGTLAGVRGTVDRSGTTLTFTRDTPGSEVSVPNEVPFNSEIGNTHSNSTSIFMLGRNDIGYSSTGTVIDRIVMANVAAVNSLSPAYPRFLILGTINSYTESRGSTNYKNVVGSNKILSEMYPDNFLDIRNYIVNQSIYDQGITPTEQDLTNIGLDRPPVSAMLDSVHYSVGTAATIAQQVHKWLINKGWAS